MWNPSKSVTLSCIFTKLVIILVICFDLTAPYVIGKYLVYAGRNPDLIQQLLFIVYTCSAPALVALFSLNKLLTNIKKGEIFIEKNVGYLRNLSWCCFAASLIMLLSGFTYILFLIIALGAAFFGLILRVVKNVIEQAMIIKNENDYTI
ncbi:DUF2975 domain-containing protein [Sinanaerobacter chloroacetimidivorans]|uniref:DUF2975 domain-containing protein n=1 Tax=Sinanaerobacter chloroacetimidivorans TaxID=2818044 RepID=A0A8J7W4U3_9FIRM|nr:DUF2975 domain-containing protein [Sinanaerobacter chloroacetimidivorans]MBR0600336.1 DUF2975 domain-containing protein [Sinanaerobacter chloroacetimidivorans]